MTPDFWKAFFSADGGASVTKQTEDESSISLSLSRKEGCNLEEREIGKIAFWNPLLFPPLSLSLSLYGRKGKLRAFRASN